MRSLNILAGILFVIIVQILPAHSEQSPELKAAIQAWLDYDDETAIPILSRLAHSGNEDAMILLGQISLRPGLSPYLLSLGRNDRNRLLKAKGGLSGKNWLRMVKKQKPLAEALYNTSLAYKRYEAVEALLQQKEIAQAARTLNIQINYGEFEKLIDLSMKQEIPENMRFLLYYSALLSNENGLQPLSKVQRNKLIVQAREEVRAYSLHGLMFVGIIGPFLKKKDIFAQKIRIGQALWSGGLGFYSNLEYADLYFGKESPKKALQDEWEASYESAFKIVQSSKEMQPLVGFCKKQCPNDILACTKFIYGSNVGYYGFMTLQSPVNKLISDVRYYSSKRFDKELLNASVRDRFHSWKDRRPNEINGCIADLFPNKK